MGTREEERGEWGGCTKLSVVTNDLEESLKAEINGQCPYEHRRDEERGQGSREMGMWRHTKISVVTNDLEESLKAEINSWCPDEYRRDKERAMWEVERRQWGRERMGDHAERRMRRGWGGRRGDEGMCIERDEGGHIEGDEETGKGQEGGGRGWGGWREDEDRDEKGG